jgi:2-dehydro-3-deoxyphosphogluconate aldolase/(4S)-4-hydroxy-2-oxoglutarate aldolase
MSNESDVTASIELARVVGILRGIDPTPARAVAFHLWSFLACPIEVPLQSASSRKTLTSLVELAIAHGRIVGAGTVINTDVHAAALECGAAFTVAPDTNPEVIIAAQRARVLHIPGVATPSDVRIATELGCTLLKAFPASSLGPSWIRELKGPFPSASFIATGGISAANADDFYEAGAVAIGVGSAIRDTELQRIVTLRQKRD